MSITFHIPGAKRVEVECHDCHYYHNDGESCPWCNDTGRRIEPECGDLNLSNVNAMDVLRLAGFVDPDYCGTIEVEDLSLVLQKLMVVANSAKRRLHLVREEESGKGVQNVVGGQAVGCNWICCGNTDEQTMSRLERFRKLVSYAKEHNLAIQWD